MNEQSPQFTLLKRTILLALLVATCCCKALAQDTIVNAYAKVLEIDSCWIRVDSSQGFQAEDFVLLHQAKGARIVTANNSDYGKLVNWGGAGLFEEHKIQFISNDTFYLYQKVHRPFNVDFSVQIVGIRPMKKFRSPRRITAKTWDSCSGGIVYLKALDSITLKHSIEASYIGYHGGKVSQTKVSCNNDNFLCDYQSGFGGEKGESYVKLTANTACRGASGNGGGGGNSSNTGGGGGANGGRGGLGGKEVSFGSGACGNPRVGGVGGLSVQYDTIGPSPGNNDLQRIFFGGGGGGGQQNNEQSDGVSGVAGMPGGGIVFINTPALYTNNKVNIFVNGQSVRDTAGRDGAGGGGAGGTVAIYSNSINGLLNIEANGGNGGSVDNNGFNSFCHGPGGGGGGGVLWLKSNSKPANITFTADNGEAGINVNTTSNCYLQTHGAVDGTDGITLYNMQLNLPTTTRSNCPLFIPKANNDSFSLQEGSTIGYNIVNNDTAEVPYTVTIITPATLGNLQKTGRDSIRYTAGLGEGYDSIYYVLCRKYAPFYCDTALILVKVLKNPAFIDLRNDSIALDEGDSANIDMLKNDTIRGSYGLELKYTGPNQVSFNSDSTQVLFKPNGRFFGKDSIPYCGCLVDRPTVCDTAWIYIDVAIDDSPPLAIVDSALVYVQSGTRIRPWLNDTFSRKVTSRLIVNHPSVNSGFVNDSVLGITWPGKQPGSATIEYEICYLDTPFGCDTAIVFIQAILDPNRPVCLRDRYQTFPQQTVETTPLDNDTIRSAIQVSIITAPVEGSISVAGPNSINYTANTTYLGPDSFQYKVSMTDSSFQEDSAWVIIDILRENLAPQAINDSYTLFKNASIEIRPLENDTDPDGNTISFTDLVEAFVNGTVDLQSNPLTYEPMRDFSGEDSALYEICDQGLPAKCDSAWIFITVKDFPAITIPTGFSPNNDQVNDLYEIENALFYTDLELVIYNRWGQILYAQKPYQNNWDGTNSNNEPLVDGTYFYLVRIESLNFEKKGYVVINR